MHWFFLGALTWFALGWVTGLFHYALARIFTIELPNWLVLNLQTVSGLDFDIINAFVPLAEGITLMTTFAGVALAVIGFRWARSFMPFMGG